MEGAKKIGRNWAVPFGSIKPMDARKIIDKEYIGLEHDFTIIDTLKEKIDEHRPFSKVHANSLHEKLLVEWTYNSNAIEGNTLTISETRVALKGITIGGKTVVEHLVIINHRDAIF